MTARLSLVPELDDTIAHASPERRAQILLQVTNLFVRDASRFSEDEISLFDDVITRLAAEIEASVRALLAHRLAPLPQAPLNIIRALASDDDIRVAGPVLVHSERLDVATLVASARAKSQAHLLAISQRTLIAEEVTDVLVERGNREVALSVAKNLGAKFSKLGFSFLVKRAHDDDQLATCVGFRPDVPHDVFVALLAEASARVRAKLIAEHPLFAHEIDHAVTVVADGIRNDPADRAVDYVPAQKLIQSLSDAGQLDEATVRAFAEDGRLGETIVAVAHICDVPVAVVERAFFQDQSETILILAKALRLSWPTAKALLTFRARQRGVSPAHIDRSMATFDRLNFETARRIVEFYRSQRSGVPN